ADADAAGRDACVEPAGGPIARGLAVGGAVRRAGAARRSSRGRGAAQRSRGAVRGSVAPRARQAERRDARQADAGARARGAAARDLSAERFAVKRLARLAGQQGPSRAAEELLRRAVELDADDRDSARSLADVEKARGDDLAYLNTLDQLLRTSRRTFEGPAREA